MAIQQRKPITLRRWEEESLESFEVSPDLYTHLVIIEALKAVPRGLETGNASEGLVALTISVDQLEQILKARGLLQSDDPYYDEVKHEIERLKAESVEGILLQGKIANYKLGLLMQIIFGTTTKDIDLIM